MIPARGRKDYDMTFSMEQSILNTIKPLVGVEVEDDSFDLDIITDINTAIMLLNKVGVGSSDGFYITGDTETWNDFLPDSKNLQAVVTYVNLKTRLLFDPPSSATVIQSMNDTIKELEWTFCQITDQKVIGG